MQDLHDLYVWAQVDVAEMLHQTPTLLRRLYEGLPKGPHDWVEMHGPHGGAFYYNKRSGGVVHERPQGVPERKVGCPWRCDIVIIYIITYTATYRHTMHTTGSRCNGRTAGPFTTTSAPVMWCSRGPRGCQRER
jgi:hypothetical protein